MGGRLVIVVLSMEGPLCLYLGDNGTSMAMVYGIRGSWFTIFWQYVYVQHAYAKHRNICTCTCTLGYVGLGSCDQDACELSHRVVFSMKTVDESSGDVLCWPSVHEILVWAQLVGVNVFSL